jgi:hypothetical protein
MPELTQGASSLGDWSNLAFMRRKWDAGLSMMTGIRGSSNAKAKRVLGWQPEYPSYGDGLRLALWRDNRQRSS